MLALHDVTRLNSGVYHCISTDTDTFEEIAGNTTLFVHCKESALIRFVSTMTESFTVVWLYGPSLNSPSLLSCVDLDPAVVIPKDTVIPQGQELKATCNALSSVDTHTAWFKVIYTLYTANTQTATRFYLNNAWTPTVIRMHLENPSYLGRVERISFCLILDSENVLIELMLRRCWQCCNHQSGSSWYRHQWIWSVELVWKQASQEVRRVVV